MMPLGRAVTPGEYAQLRRAIQANWEREKARILQSGPPLGTNFSRITATRIRLGPLGQALVVYFGRSPECGATGNCPMAVYVREPAGYRRVISDFGWGYALLPSGGPVPDVAFYSNVSCCESTAARYHYAEGKFVPAGGADCKGKNTGAICAAMSGAAHRLAERISPAKYEALRPAIEASLEELPSALARRYSFDDAHGVIVLFMQEVKATAVGLGPCGLNQNCNISIYARHYRNPKGVYWPLLRGAIGWGAAESTFAGEAGRQIAFVIARHLSANEDELTRYTVPMMAAPGPGNLSRESRLLPEACEIVTPKTGNWPARWDPSAMVARPVSCFGATHHGKSSVSMTDTTNISKIVQDGSGTVWGLRSGFFSQLYRWSNEGWSRVPTPAPVASSAPEAERQPNVNERIPRPIGLWKGPDGGVLTIWLKSSLTGDSELVWQRDNQAKILASLPGGKQPGRGPMDVTNVAPAANGIVLVTRHGGDSFRNGVRVSGPAPGLFRVSADGHVQRIFRFSRNEYLRYRTVRGRPTYFLPLHTTRDAQGRVWIWCGWTWPPGPPGAAFAGFLVTNWRTAEYHRRILRMRFPHLITVGVWDKNHLAAATLGSGLYNINTTTLVARHIPEPEPGAFFFVRKVFSIGEDHYVLTLGPNPRIRVRPEFRAFLTDALWRYHKGQWEEVLGKVGKTSGVGLATRRGFWLARDERGLFFVPLNRPPKRVDWRQGFPLANVSQLFELADGNVLAYGRTSKSRTVEIRTASVLRRKPPHLRFSVVHPLTNIEPGLHHNLWGLLPNRVLGEWKGKRWDKHPVPYGINPSRISGLDVDTRGRVWLFPDCHLGPMGFYNPADGRWKVFPSYMKALSQRSEHVKFLHPADDKTRPIYGPNSQIVFVGQCNALNYFNGAAWSTFLAWHLPGSRVNGSPPFFDAAGHMALDIRNSTWQWIPETGWENTAGRPPAHYIPVSPNPFTPPLPPPMDCQSPPPAALVKDSLGQSWWVADDALYEGVAGHCRKVLSGSARQPFIDGRKLVAAEIGPRGNAFLGTTRPSSYILLPRKMYGGKRPSNRRHRR
jgi:hypothetical protein